MFVWLQILVCYLINFVDWQIGCLLKFNLDMFQINLRPFYDENQTQAQCTVDGVTGVCAQLVPFGGIGTLGLTTELLLPGLKHLSTDSRYTNNVQLFYMICCHINRLINHFGEFILDFTGPQMVATIKLTSFG